MFATAPRPVEFRVVDLAFSPLKPAPSTLHPPNISTGGWKYKIRKGLQT